MAGERVGDEETHQLAAICTLQFAAVDELVDAIRAAAHLGLGFEAQSLMALDDPADISSDAAEVYKLRLRGRPPYPDARGRFSAEILPSDSGAPGRRVISAVGDQQQGDANYELTA